MVGVAVPLAHGDPDWTPLERARHFEVYADFICIDTVIGDQTGETAWFTTRSPAAASSGSAAGRSFWVGS